MKFKPDKKYIQWGMTVFFTALAIMIVYFLFFRIDEIKSGLANLNSILAPVFYGFIFAYLMSPLLNTVEQKWIGKLFNKKNWIKENNKRKKHVRRISVLITFIIVLLVLYIFFASVIPQVYFSVETLISNYSVYTKNLTTLVNSTMDKNPEIAKFLTKMIANTSLEADDFLNDVVMPEMQTLLWPNINDMITSVSTGVIKIVKVLWNLVIGLIISVYVLSSKEKFKQGCVRICYAFLENKNANKFIYSLRFIHQTFIGFLSGKVIDSAIIGIICYFFCLFSNMPYPVLISVIIGVTNIIPFLGPAIGAVPTALIILLVEPKKALIFVIFIIILQQFDGNFLGPMILAQSTGLTSFWIIFAITLFGGWFGIIGMVIGVPIMAIVITWIDELTKKLLQKKNLPTDNEAYKNVGSVSDDGIITQYVYVKPEREHKENKFLNKIGAFFKNLFLKIFKKKTKTKP